MVSSGLPQLPPGTLTNLVWQASYASLAWLEGQAVPAASGQALALAQSANLVLTTLVNGLAVLNVQDILAGIARDLPLLQATAALPITYTGTQVSTLTGRIAAMQIMQAALPSIYPTTWPTPASALPLGLPAISPASDLLTTLLLFAGESPPPYLADATWGSVQSGATTYTTTWASIASAVSGYYALIPPGAPLDACNRATSGSALAQALVTGALLYPASQTLTTSQVWNQNVATPALLSAMALTQPDLSTSTGQASMVTRAFLITMATQVAIFQLLCESLVGTGVAAQTTQATQGQGLMDVAAGALGNFESWPTLRTGIAPPWGASELSIGQTVQLVSGQMGIPANPLGTDIYLGAQNQPMPAWTGDFLTTTGLLNYRYALGRRLATTLGALIYEPTYGSRIPPEIGAIQSAGGAAMIAAFGQSALAADPRTQRVVSAQATAVSGQPYAINFLGTVVPVGVQSSPQTVNQVLAGSSAASSPAIPA